jgi:uncharacterized protein (DUF427 family)
MTLTMDTGPLSGRPPGQANYRIEGPAHNLLFTTFPRRVRAVVAGHTVLDTDRGMLLHETGLLPQLYAPEEDLETSVLAPSSHTTHCPFKGDASYRDVLLGDRVAENAVWSYPDPMPASSWLAGYAAMYWRSADSWFDEDEEVFGHLRDPYHRVDARTSSRHVRVLAGSQVLAESTRPLLVSETGLVNRYYLPPEDVRLDLLSRSETVTVCPYKGTSTYWSLGDDVDAGWSYDRPLDDFAKADGYVTFDHPALTVEASG